MRRIRRAPTAFVLLALLPLLGACDSVVKENVTKERGTPEGGTPPTVEEPAEDEGLGRELGSLFAGVKPPRSYELESIPPNGGPSMTMIVKMGDKEPLKIKTVYEEGWMLVDRESGSTYAYEPSENIVMKLPIGAGSRDAALNPGDLVDLGATTLGRGRIDGVDCWIVESAAGPLENKVWIGFEDGLPRQFESQEGITRFVYSRINEVPDNEFALPEGVEVMDMAKMMQQGFR